MGGVKEWATGWEGGGERRAGSNGQQKGHEERDEDEEGEQEEVVVVVVGFVFTFATEVITRLSSGHDPPLFSSLSFPLSPLPPSLWSFLVLPLPHVPSPSMATYDPEPDCDW